MVDNKTASGLVETTSSATSTVLPINYCHSTRDKSSNPTIHDATATITTVTTGINNSNTTTYSTLVRPPTEAQLRWAQFHRPTRAVYIRQYVEQTLWQSPATIAEVYGDKYDDENTITGITDPTQTRTTTTTTATATTRIHDETPNHSIPISDGRYALLKVSQQAYEQRRQSILEHGYRWDTEESETVIESVITDYTPNSKPIHNTETLACIFAESSQNHRQRRRRKRRQNQYNAKGSQERERIERFEAALYATLRHLSQHHYQQHQQQDMVDLKWGVLPKQSNKNPKFSHQWTPDRSASWLVHAIPYRSAPSSSRAVTDDIAHNEQLRKHLTGLARTHLEDDENKGPVNDEDVATLVEEIERHLNHGESHAQQLLRRFEPIQNATGKIATPSNIEDTTTTPIQKYLQASDTNRQIQYRHEDDQTKRLIVQQIIDQIEAATVKTENHQWLTIDGKLHKTNFAKLVEQYLNQFLPVKYDNVVTNSSGESCDTFSHKNDGTSSWLVQSILDQMQNDVDMETIVTPQGCLDKDRFAILMHRYLASIQSNNQNNSDDYTNMEEFMISKTHPVTSHPEMVLQTLTRVGTSNNATGGIWGHFRNARDKILELRSDLVTTLSDSRKEENENISNHTTPRVTGSSGRTATEFGKIFPTFHHPFTTSNEATSPPKTASSDPEDLQEYYAFRQTQEERRRSTNATNEDGGSSLSSFRILPAGLRRVVERVRSAQLSSETPNDNGKGEAFKDAQSFDESSMNTHQEIDTRSMSNSGTPSSEFAREDVQHLQTALMRSASTSGQQVIDTDSNSDVIGDEGMKVLSVSSLMLSPTLLTKRHQQAIRAVECRKWDQVAYLLNANPWLVEMADVTTNQYILHKLAFFGAGSLEQIEYTEAGKGIVVAPAQSAAPEKLYKDCLMMFPSAVHKFDNDGDLPLHMAAAAGNLPMMRLLGDQFPSGASVRNEDGMLPLHLAILACGTPAISHCAKDVGQNLVRTLLNYFPGALAVIDNEGNLPIHTAAAVLRGDFGASIIMYLIDETARQVAGPSGLRFQSKIIIKDIDDSTSMSEHQNSVGMNINSDEETDTNNCLLVRNELNDTPLAAAVYSGAGWEIVELLTCKEAALQPVDAELNTVLHLLVSEQYYDASAAVALLQIVPEAAAIRNIEGMLPIEIACMQSPLRDLILAFAIIDLPIDLDRPNSVQLKNGYGSSWWYITCECDDFYVDIVEEIVSLSTFAQIRALASWTNNTSDSLTTRATPKCREVLLSALRFVGRYEFVSNFPIHTDDTIGFQVFDVLDYGGADDPFVDGRRVLLRCYTRQESFDLDTTVLRELSFDRSYFEEIESFTLSGEDPSSPLPTDGKKRFFVAVEKSELTLSGVVRGMLSSHDCQNDAGIRSQYTIKVFAVLRLVAKALRVLHNQGFVHGDLCLENCGKFENDWKVSDLLGAQKIGHPFNPHRLSSSAPPEAVEMVDNKVSRFLGSLTADVSLDVWAFGKVAYEVIVGDTLIEFDVSKPIESDFETLASLSQWNSQSLQHVQKELQQIGVIESGISLITKCLSPDPQDRPSIDDVLGHKVWNEIRRSTTKVVFN